ncbi:hypothetical protein [Emcibacter nanhaiensis]|uniref:Uncharacterized protein n=1 Tax=Emcibacter nanhaiensis TaxID=1505037 RepID=A0A501PBJ3_9PROT|nr:hypothetical protein [Emcibacter nanhaiensis]TPD57779.1 hypothetical protein FIV46_16890 [Emcibacter nanhaiensis]
MTGGVQSALAQTDEAANPEELDAQRYGACLRLVEDKPQEALSFAREWNVERQGLSAARHCEALALLALDRSAEAAELLEREADNILTGDGLGDYAQANRRKLRTDLYSQAALAWQRANELDKAYSALSSALLAAGEDEALIRDIYLERGRIQSLRREHQAAIQDLTRAIELAPAEIEGYFLRAKVFRYKKNYAAARLDISAALDLDRDDPDVLLESGILYRVTGEKLKAGQEWKKVLELYPDSEYAATAKENLDLMAAD